MQKPDNKKRPQHPLTITPNKRQRTTSANSDPDDTSSPAKQTSPPSGGQHPLIVSKRKSQAELDLADHLLSTRSAEGLSHYIQPQQQDNQEEEATSSMGNCIASKNKDAGVLPPPSPAAPSSVSSKPEQQTPARPPSGVHGSRRRLSLIHAEPITHPSEDGPRGTVFQSQKLSLETMLAQNGAGTRLSLMGVAAHRKQTNFETKHETLRGNVRATALVELGIGHSCRKGLKPESPNQDDFFIYQLDTVGLFGVFDGHGPYGHDISNFVQQNLPRYLYDHPSFDSDPQQALKFAFAKVQTEIERCCDRREFDAALSGCTATVIVHNVPANKLYIAHVGDSRAVLARQSSTDPSAMVKPPTFTAIELTEDHKPTLPRERARIEAKGGEVKRLEGDIPHRVFLKDELYPGLAMSRALGDLVAGRAGVSAEPEVSTFDLDPRRDTFLVICSDGVWEFISSQDAVDIVANKTEGDHSQVQIAADELALRSWNKWIEEEEDVVDDITVEVIWIKRTLS